MARVARKACRAGAMRVCFTGIFSLAPEIFAEDLGGAGDDAEGEDDQNHREADDAECYDDLGDGGEGSGGTACQKTECQPA